MRIPASVQGMLFAPVLICLFFILKAFCPESAGNSCFADQFAVPIFLPLVAIYKIFGDSSIIGGHEFLLILIYWAFIGLLLGFLFDLFRPTRVQVSQPRFVPPPPPKEAPVTKEIPKPIPSPKPLPPPPPPPVTSIPIMKIMPTSPGQIPRAYQVQPVAQSTLATKPWTAPVPTVPEPPKPKLPINILDRKKEDWPTAPL